MYILTFKSKINNSLFGSIGVFDNLKQITERIINNQTDIFNGTVKSISYENALPVKNKLKYDQIENYLKNDFNRFCTSEIEGDNHFYNIREQKDIQRIK